MTARRQASSAVPSVLTAAISKVVRRGPLDSDDELSSARGALEKLEGTWNGAALAINNLSKVRRGRSFLFFRDQCLKFLKRRLLVFTSRR